MLLNLIDKGFSGERSVIFQKLSYYEIVDIRILEGLSLLLFQDFNNSEHMRP